VAKNVFNIPPHVVLPENQHEADCQYTAEDTKKLDTEIQQLKEKIMAVSSTRLLIPLTLDTITATSSL